MATETPDTDEEIEAVKRELHRKRQIKRLLMLVGIGVVLVVFYYFFFEYLGFEFKSVLSDRAKEEFGKFVNGLVPPHFDHLTPYTRENDITGFVDPIVATLSNPGTLWEAIVAAEPGSGYNIIPAAFTTIAAGVSGTILGFPLALLFGVLGTERVTPFPFNFIFRGVMSTIRAIPAIIWVIIYLPIFGINPVTAVLAIGTDTIGNLGRLFAEELEEIDEGPIEAIRSTGAGRAQTIIFGMLSQVTNSFIAWTLYILEINTRIAISLGVLGVGGLGMYIDGEVSQFAWKTAAGGIVMVIIIVISIEFISTRIRAYLRPGESESRSILDIIFSLGDWQKWAGTKPKQEEFEAEDGSEEE